MTPEETKVYQETIITLWRQIHGLQAGEEAMAKIMLELEPHVSHEVFTVLLKYFDYKSQASQEILIQFEKTNPWLAAELDKFRPPISPDEPPGA
jgi:hypothetical protein